MDGHAIETIVSSREYYSALEVEVIDREIGRGLWFGPPLCALAVLLGGEAVAAIDETALRSLADRMDGCGQIVDDALRLECYDQARLSLMKAPAAPASPAPAPAPADVAMTGAAGDQAAARIARRSIRVEIGFGYESGNYAGASKTAGGILEANSVTGGQGGGLVGQAWLDDWPARNLSFGLGFLQINNRGALTATLPKGVSVLTDPVYAHMGVAVQADAAFFNLAWRPINQGRARAMVGVGLGLGYARATEDDIVENDFIGVSSGLSKSAAPFAGLQGFTAVEYYFNDRVYVSLTPRILFVSAHPIGINQRYADFIMSANLGYRFP